MDTAIKSIAEDIFSKNGTAKAEDFQAAQEKIIAEIEKKKKNLADEMELAQKMAEEEIAEAEQLQADLELSRKANEAKKIAALKTELAMHKVNAESFEKKADRYREKADIDDALLQRDICLTRIAEIEKQLGAIAPPAEVFPVLGPVPNVEIEEIHKPTFVEKIFSFSGTAWIAIIMLIGLAYFAYHQVDIIGQDINRINKIAEDSGNVSQMLPPSISKMSYQRAWFGWFNIFTCFTILIALMAIIVPDKLIFLLPFTRDPKNKWKEFFNQSEQQKQWQSFAWFAAILFSLVLSLSMGK